MGVHHGVTEPRAAAEEVLEHQNRWREPGWLQGGGDPCEVVQVGETVLGVSD